MEPKPGSLPAALSDRITQLERELVAQRKRTDFSANVTAAIGLLILILLGGYFYYGYSSFSEVTKPEKIIQTAQTLLEDNLPTARKAIEAEVKKSAPAWAEGLSKQAQESIPKAREKLEDYVLTQIDETLKKGTVLTDEQFNTFIKNNRNTLERSMKELGKDPKAAEESMGELAKALEDQLRVDLQNQAREMFTALKSCIATLKKLQEGRNLSPYETNFRRVLMIARRLQTEKTGPSSAAKIEAAALAPTSGGTTTPPAETPAPVAPTTKPKGKPAD
jgi:hypothetical protein